MVRAGMIPSVRLGRRVYIPRKAFDVLALGGPGLTVKEREANAVLRDAMERDALRTPDPRSDFSQQPLSKPESQAMADIADLAERRGWLVSHLRAGARGRREA